MTLSHSLFGYSFTQHSFATHLTVLHYLQHHLNIIYQVLKTVFIIFFLHIASQLTCPTMNHEWTIWQSGFDTTILAACYAKQTWYIKVGSYPLMKKVDATRFPVIEKFCPCVVCLIKAVILGDLLYSLVTMAMTIKPTPKKIVFYLHRNITNAGHITVWAWKQ